MQLSYQIQNVFYHLYPYPEKVIGEIYVPISILQYINSFNIKNTPNALIKFILNNLHKELNEKNINNNKKLRPNIYNKNEVIKCEIKNFSQYNNSQIYNTFNWFLIKESQCCKCNRAIYEFKTNNIVDFDILKAYTYYKKNYLTIYDCLKYNELSKQLNMYCGLCGDYIIKVITPKIYSSSNMFIFSLDRGNLDPNLLTVNFFIEERIDLSRYIENPSAPRIYELHGIISIYMQQKKYVCCCKSPVDNNWYYYEDEKSFKLQSKVMIQNHNNNNFIPCLLVYKALKN
jgi:hypothetical protein